jgi:hypothetical protein
MIDLHSHILPGIDDGATSLEMSLDMARMAVADGVHTMACTPHIYPGLYLNDAQGISRARQQLQAALDVYRIALTLVDGADVHLVPGLLEGLRAGAVPTLHGSRYVLLEPSPTASGAQDTSRPPLVCGSVSSARSHHAARSRRAAARRRHSPPSCARGAGDEALPGQLAHAGQQRHGGPVDVHRAAAPARHLQRVAGQAEAGDVGQRVHAGSAARSGPGVLSCVV